MEKMILMAKNIYEKIMIARLQFLESNPQKSGENKFQNFKYYELDDIVPTATRLCNDLKIYTEIDMGAENYGYATMTVVNIEEPSERVQYRIKMPELTGGNINQLLQDTGRTETYLRRYLYLLFLDIVQNDEVDASDNRKSTATKPRNRPTTVSTKKGTTQPLTTNKRLTMKQKKELSELDPVLEKIISEGSNAITMKQILEALQEMEDSDDLTSDERLTIAKKISTIQ